jgi:hypothetical protein
MRANSRNLLTPNAVVAGMRVFASSPRRRWMHGSRSGIWRATWWKSSIWTSQRMVKAYR